MIFVLKLFFFILFLKLFLNNDKKKNYKKIPKVINNLILY